MIETSRKNRDRGNIDTPLAPTKFLTPLATQKIGGSKNRDRYHFCKNLGQIPFIAFSKAINKWYLSLFLLASVFIAVILFYSQAWAFTASYEQTISGTGLPEPQTSAIKIKDDKMRVEANSPEGRVISIMDGKTVYSYLPSRNMAVKFVVQGTPRMETLSNYGAYLESLGAQVIGSERVGQYDCDIYEFTDPRTQMMSKIWLWKRKQFPVKVETKVQDGVVSTIIKNLKIGIDIDDSEFVLPPGVEIKEMR